MTAFRLPIGYTTRIDKSKRPPFVKCSNARYWTKLYWATPPWLTDTMIKAMQDIYKRAGGAEHVDHIVPLVSKIVCGLHVPWNLQIIEAKKNMSKSNTAWPNHPFENQDLFPPIGDHERQRGLL